jgi:hypothetical protein
MRRFVIGLVAAALVLGLFAGAPAEAKVYKMSPEERAAALKEKKKQRKTAKKSGKPAPGHDQGGWVEVKPGEKIAKKNRASKVDELSNASKSKVKKSKKAAEKPPKKSAAANAKADTGRKSRQGAAKKPDAKVAETVEQAPAKKTGRKTATHGDRLVTRDFVGERKVSASSTEVRRAVSAPARAPAPESAPGTTPAAAPAQTPAPVTTPVTPSAAVAAPASKADDLPRQDKAPVAPQVRQEVQPGPVDAARPVSTQRKAGEGRF